ncbi:SDR family oxidoreductase [Endozoicomonas sp. G2_2]|uniref:SDR family oxidoreductase n=1 Tax=Endozoicomonas sp. G2_2 TaxID=2821092 RepID=UPI001ADAC1CD|nr:SDR family oxidoreductase [Endozoicomonas sp. G2_2]MBO9470829.1 SDR family oxidoreductase [Endozoicomonas sp. G2_2]
MTNESETGVALVAGAGGIIGHATAHELADHGWTVRAQGRRAVPGFETVQADLTDANATRRAVEQAGDTTHLFYAALNPDADLATEATRNADMLGNLLDALEAVGAPLQRVVIYQGFKIYGIHLGANVRTPARESDPPHMPPNLYQAQEAQLKARADSAAWDYVALRPDVVVGDIHGNPMNIALVIGVYAEISRALGIPLRFPGSDQAFVQMVQTTDAALLGRASAWAAREPSAGGEAFNVTNADTFRWERMFENVAAHLGLETARPVPITLTEHMADKGPLWRELAEKHDLVEPDLDKLVGWGFGDFIFNTETDVVSDVNKIYRHGFTERMDSSRSLLAALDRLKSKRIIP